MYELCFFVGYGFGCFLEIDFRVARHHANEISGAIASQDDGLEHPAYILAEAFSHVGGREVALVNLIRYKAVGYVGAVEQTCRIGLLYLFHRMQS